MKYLKTFENTVLLSFGDFNKSVYIPEDRAIIAAYMITKDDGKFINVLNIKETKTGNIFMDNHVGYDITIHNTLLNKSKVQVVGDVTEFPGFSYLKIPYGIFKTNQEALEIKRGKDKLKRLSIPAKKTEDNPNFMINFKDINVINYLKSMYSDERTNYLLSLYANK